MIVKFNPPKRPEIPTEVVDILLSVTPAHEKEAQAFLDRVTETFGSRNDDILLFQGTELSE